MSNKLYRPCVGIMLYKPDVGIFSGKRKGKFDYAWQMPQGGIDKDEEHHLAAFRELEEETSITSAKIINQTDDWHYYDLPEELVKNFWNGRYSGQKQKWFLMEFTGSDDEININTKNPEFIKWQWSNPDFLIQNIVPFKQKIYQDIFNYFL